MWMPRKTVLTLLAVVIVAGCGGARDDEVSLRKIRHKGNGPDEFSIIPGKPLEMPEDVAALPEPVPGGGNRTDQDPVADGIAALGGNAGARRTGAPSAANAGLLTHAARYDRDPAIRQTLAAEDRELRRDYGNVNILRILPSDDYTQAYKDQWLDPYAEEQRLRRRGVRTPAAPPAPRDQ
ncbi:DUF3035 domain-containing protein [Roseovarius nitratireducens]|uniref:DUF3035 domain-containing protein n=1 Tax=Roseovarius nitratireducens TaxID=2044597 RepID=UPI000CE16B8E|nr:DUF3035 domain-containing protein [Roseovarius nitratireducens]